MCLRSSADSTQELLKRPGSYIYAYKLVRVTGGGLDSIHFGHNWKPGVNKSNYKGKKLTWAKDGVVRRGIHVFLHKPHHDCCYGNRAIIRVKCYLRDLIGASGSHAAFTKVILSHGQYKRATGG